jgi:hypothetical protein
MATLLHPQRRPGDRPAESGLGAEPSPGAPAATAAEIVHPQITPGAAAPPAGRAELVPVMQGPADPGTRRQVVGIRVAETDALWWFG